MDLISKKNGTITRVRQLISAVASKIGFTPPKGMSATNVQDAIEEVANYGKFLSGQTWTPKVYDFNTYKRDLPDGSYTVIGNLVIATLYSTNTDLSGIDTMLQIRNLPLNMNVLAGNIYIAGDTNSGGGLTIQATTGGIALLRPNWKSSMTSTPSNVGIANGVFIGSVV